MSVSEDSKVYVSATFFRVHPGKENQPAVAVSTQCFNRFFFFLPKSFNKFNIKVDVATSYLSDIAVNMRKHKFMKSRSAMQEIKNRRPQKSFTFECRCLTRDLISKVISDANIPFSLHRILWTDQNQKVNWIPLKNSDDVVGHVLDITNSMEISPAVSDRKQKEFTLLLSITKETIIPHHEFERNVRQTKELARDTSTMVQFLQRISNVKVLNLSGNTLATLDGGSRKHLAALDNLPSFHNLRHLKVDLTFAEVFFYSTNVIFCILEHSPNLEFLILEIDNIWMWDSPASVPKCLSSTLKVVQFEYFNGSYEDHMGVVEYLLKNSLVGEVDPLTMWTTWIRHF